MSKNDKNIDAYSKALLDKKTEYNDELKKPKEVHQMSEAERRQAEKTMSSALDMLRKERGQKTIAEEEQFYQEHKDFNAFLAFLYMAVKLLFPLTEAHYQIAALHSN